MKHDLSKAETPRFGVRLWPHELDGAIAAARAALSEAETSGRVALARCRRARVATLEHCRNLAERGSE